MKKTISVHVFFLIFLFSFLILISCGQKEKDVAAEMIQIQDKDLQEKNEAIYKTLATEGKEKSYLSLDFSRIEKPASLDEFSQQFHFPPIRQGNTGTCWSFATTSLFESELKRLGRKEVKLSELYTVYWEFVEKARRYIREKGNSALGHGSEHNAVVRQMKTYGAMPAKDYTGLLFGQKEHDHDKLFQELRNYLEFCKDHEYWDEEKAISYVKSILDKYLGKPPETIVVDGQTLTPKEYLEKVLMLPLDDYVSFISFKYLPFYSKGEYKVPDNWWHSQDYYNLPLDDFYNAILGAIKKGFTVGIGGDISEPGNSGENNLAIIPSYDLPRKLIDQDSREFRFSNRTSTDDHATHLVGYKEKGNETWFLIKDSWETAFRGPIKGYFFYRDDYMKLKVLSFMVHKDAVKEYLEKFEK